MGYVNVVYHRYHPALDQSLGPFHSSTDGSSNRTLNFERRSGSFVPYSNFGFLLCFWLGGTRRTERGVSW
jgi:hypothetical protein